MIKFFNVVIVDELRTGFTSDVLETGFEEVSAIAVVGLLPEPFKILIF